MAANVNASVSPEPLHPSLSVSLRLSRSLSASVIEIKGFIYIEFGEGFSRGQNLSTFCLNSKAISSNGKSMLCGGEGLLPLCEIMSLN